MQLPRAVCPVCGRRVAVRRGGELREHRARVTDDKLCEASGIERDAGAAMLAAALAHRRRRREESH